jgi:hypothetical protein
MTFLRGVAAVSRVSQVDFSRSPAVLSIAGYMHPTASIITRKIGSIIPKMNCPI